MDHRLAGAWTMAAALSALGVAYFAQFVLLLSPCELCLWERWPYRVVALLGLFAMLSRPATGRIFLGLAAGLLLGGAAIAFLHAGVEFGWWNSPLPACNGALVPGQALPATPATPCGRPVFLIARLPVSMAVMDFCAYLAFALLLLAYVRTKPRRFR